MTAPAVEQPAAPVCAATGCTRPADPFTLCAPDVRRLGDWIAQIQTEYELLSAVPSMQGREIGSIGGGTLAAQRSVGRENVMVLRDPRSKERSELDPDGNNGRGVLEVLYAYAEQVREERDLAQPVTYVQACLFPCMHRACLLGMGHPVRVPLTVARERKLLAVHLPWICEQQWAGEFFDDVRRLWSALRSANGHAAPGARGVRCRETVAGDVCGGPITLADGAARCGTCGTTTSGPELLRVAAAGAAA